MCSSGGLFCVKVKSDRTHPVVLLHLSQLPSPVQNQYMVGGASLLLNLGELRQYGSVGDRHAGRMYSGDDEHWPQWVLKCEAWSELVGWGRQLDAAAPTLPIVNTTLETEVQTISRPLCAILVVKLEGEALGIVPGQQG